MSYALSHDSSGYSEVVINSPDNNNYNNIHKNLMNHSHHMHERGLEKKIEKKFVKTAPHHWIESVEKHFSLFKFWPLQKLDNYLWSQKVPDLILERLHFFSLDVKVSVLTRSPLKYD